MTYQKYGRPLSKNSTITSQTPNLNKEPDYNSTNVKCTSLTSINIFRTSKTWCDRQGTQSATKKPSGSSSTDYPRASLTRSSRSHSRNTTMSTRPELSTSRRADK